MKIKNEPIGLFFIETDRRLCKNNEHKLSMSLYKL